MLIVNCNIVLLIDTHICDLQYSFSKVFTPIHPYGLLQSIGYVPHKNLVHLTLNLCQRKAFS